MVYSRQKVVQITCRDLKNMAKVEFFDWKLDISNPIMLQKISVPQALNHPQLDIHSALHLLVVTDGIHYGRCGSWKQRISSGEMFLTAPWEPHCTLAGANKTMLVINMAPEAIKNFFFTGHEKIEQLFSMPPEKRFEYLNGLPDKKRYMDSIISIADAADSPGKKLHLWHAVLDLLLACDPPPDSSRADFMSNRRLQPVFQHLKQQGLPLEDAATLCNLSISRFSTIFKANFGISYARYERLFRLNGAADSIRRGATLKEAAAEWGFCDKSHLARLLKQQNTPKG